MAFFDMMKELVDQGISASRDFVSKAGAKAQDLGEKGVLKLEIIQLENQARKLVARLGAETYAAFVEREQPSIARDETVVEEILAELAKIKELLEKREGEFKTRN